MVQIKALSVRRLVLPFILLMSSGMIGFCQSSQNIGVREGDWARYEVTRITHYDVVYAPFGMESLFESWLVVEIKNVSDSIVTYNLSGFNRLGLKVAEFTLQFDSQHGFEDFSYVIPSNMNLGDILGTRRLWDNVTNSVILGILTVNTTEPREYGGVERLANSLCYSEFQPEGMSTQQPLTIIYQEQYWDKASGILLERKIQCYAFPPNPGEQPCSEWWMKIVDTNLWQMNNDHQSPLRLLSLSLPVIGVAVVAFGRELRRIIGHSRGDKR
ncbi:hypothetical protein A3K79_00890 [Candidatus Bathyarchaeota archaeon RBG_13_46_16b]|nr:MAG: hypothetical protein A3K79_00890 [Candidatus Bathyarchaeota archaeon RBG_13_46_16b]